MTIAVDVANLGGATSVSGTNSISFTTGSAVASNGFIVVGGWWFADDTITVTMSGGGLSWATDGYAKIVGGAANDLWVASAQAPSGLASGTTITATMSTTSAAMVIGGMSLTGVATSSALDGTVLSQEQTATTSWATPSYSIQAGSVLIGIAGTDATGTGSTTVSPSLEAWDRADVGNGFGAVCGYRIEASAGSYTVAGTWGASVNSASLGVAYLAPAGPAPTPSLSSVDLSRFPKPKLRRG